MSVIPFESPTVPLPRSPLTARRVAIGVLIALVALPFLGSGLGKALGAPMFATAFPAMHYPLWFMHLLGVLEISGAVGLVFRRTRVLAAAGLASILFGAIATHIVGGQSVASTAMPAGLIVILAAIVGLDLNTRFTLQPSPANRARRLGTVGLGALAALPFLGGGLMKVTGAPELLHNLQSMNYSPLFIHLLGALELLGAVGLLIPRVRVPAAFGLAAILHGAVASHIVHGDPATQAAPAFVLIALLYTLIALDGRFTVLVDGTPAWQRFAGRPPRS